MTDETTNTPGPGDRNGSGPADPFAGLSIDFGGDTGAVPLAAATAPIAFGPEVATPDSGWTRGERRGWRSDRGEGRHRRLRAGRA